MPDVPDLGAVFRLMRMARANAENIRHAAEVNRQLIDSLAEFLGPEPLPEFIPTEFQQELLRALKGKALRTDALAAKLDCPSSRLFKHPGGLPELQEHGLVAHNKRLGYYRPDAPPAEKEGAANG